MKITVKLFASFREATGEAERIVDVEQGTTVGRLWEEIVTQNPRLSPLSGDAGFALNKRYTGPDSALQEGDEVAFLPPVSGG